MGATLKELSDLYARKQPQQVDNITEETPILARVPFEEASHGLWNVYERVSDVTGASLVDMDAVLPEVSADTELQQVDLGIMGGKITVPEDRAKMFGGKEEYFATKMPKIERQTGMNTEEHILYDNFRQFAIDEGGDNIQSAGGSSNCYTLLAVRFVGGETTGLYSPEGFNQGAMLNMLAINGGNIYEDSSGRLVYGMRLKGYYGIQIANPNTVAAIVNVNASNVPSKTQIDDMLHAVRASSNTFLMCHPKVLSMLNTYKDSALQMRPGDENYPRGVMSWDGVPFLTSYNFKDGTEGSVSV
jgi:hypothetical protein